MESPLNFERTIGSRCVNVSRIKEPSITVLSMTLKNWRFSSKNLRFSSCYLNFFPKKNLKHDYIPKSVLSIFWELKCKWVYNTWVDNRQVYIPHSKNCSTLVLTVSVLCVYGLRLTLYASANGTLEYIGSISRPKLGIDGIEVLWELLLNKYKVPIGGWMHKV
jgi:hypothetical protein